MNKKQKKNLQRIIAAVVLVLILKLLPQFPTPVELALYCIPYLVVGWDVLRKALLGKNGFASCKTAANALFYNHSLPL